MKFPVGATVTVKGYPGSIATVTEVHQNGVRRLSFAVASFHKWHVRDLRAERG